MHVPTDRPLTDPELEAVIAHVLLGTTSAGTLQLSFPSDVDQAANRLGLTGKAKDMFLRHNREGYVREFNGLVNTLISLGLVVRDWSLDRHDVYRVTERGRDALQNRTTLATSEHLGYLQSLNDPELKARCSDTLLRTSAPHAMVRDACAVLEDRIRSRVSEGVGTYGQALVNEVFRPGKGRLVLGETEAEQESSHRLYQGVMGFFGNPTHHRLLPDLPAQRARQVVGFIDTLLLMLDEAKDRA